MVWNTILWVHIQVILIVNCIQINKVCYVTVYGEVCNFNVCTSLPVWNIIAAVKIHYSVSKVKPDTYKMKQRKGMQMTFTSGKLERCCKPYLKLKLFHFTPREVIYGPFYLMIVYYLFFCLKDCKDRNSITWKLPWIHVTGEERISFFEACQMIYSIYCDLEL